MVISIKKISILIVLFTYIFCLASCLKNKGYEDVITDDGAKAIAAIADAELSDFKVFALDVTPSLETINAIRIYLGERGVAKKNYTIKIVKNAGLIADYNSAHGTNFLELPANAYTGSFDIVVEAGKNTADLVLNLDKTKFDLAKSYALGLQIADASGAIINPNAKSIVVNIGLKNKWDGVYRIKGFVDHPTAAFKGPFDAPEVELQTSGPNSVTMEAQPFFNNGTLAFFGVYPTFTISEPSNAVTVTVTPVVQSAGVPYTNKYDPATKTFFCHYGYSSNTRLIFDTCYFVKPR